MDTDVVDDDPIAQGLQQVASDMLKQAKEDRAGFEARIGEITSDAEKSVLSLNGDSFPGDLESEEVDFVEKMDDALLDYMEEVDKLNDE